MKIQTVKIDFKTNFIIVKTSTEQSLTYPLSKLDGSFLDIKDISKYGIDEELGNEAIFIKFKNGNEEFVHIEQFLEFNNDPDYFRNLALYDLNILVLNILDQKKVKKAELVRKLGTSPAQLYRLLDPSYKNKSIDQLIKLMAILGMRLDFSAKALGKISFQVEDENKDNVLKFISREELNKVQNTHFESIKACR